MHIGRYQLELDGVATVHIGRYQFEIGALLLGDLHFVLLAGLVVKDLEVDGVGVRCRVGVCVPCGRRSIL